MALKEFSASSISLSLKGPVMELLENIISKGDALVFILKDLRSLIVEKISVIIVVIYSKLLSISIGNKNKQLIKVNGSSYVH